MLGEQKSQENVKQFYKYKDEEVKRKFFNMQLQREAQLLSGKEAQTPVKLRKNI